ncbi:hypothetical protein GCM10023156_50250 [Novipirellula rosea]|uniref:Uncharacterized protein n=2 Tax=Novipirellula rosea TaxID=1031540 RepID=A0ABP8NAP7_9BACT
MNAMDGLSDDLVLAICQTDEEALIRCFSEVQPDQQQLIAIRMSDCIRQRKSQSILIVGLAIHLFTLATPEASRRKQIEVMEEETGVKRTQQIRCRNAFLRLGRPLLTDPKLASLFVPEATKRLCEPGTQETATYEALKRARAGEIITIRVADAIIAAHAPPPNVVNNSNRPRRPAVVNAIESVPVDVSATEGGKDDATYRRTREDELDAETMKGVSQRRNELQEKKSSQGQGLGQLVHQDNAVQVFVRSVNPKNDPTTEEIMYAIQQAYKKLCSGHPVQAIVLEPLETYQSGENFHV